MSKISSDASGSSDITTACELLDKLCLEQLHLLEEKMASELNIETSINDGSIHLAKSRYIMGQSSVSSTRLPVESSSEFSASTVCETAEEYGLKQLKVVENSAENTVNPMHWFGVLVPQNMYRAQSIFQNALNYVVECVNIQLQLDSNLKSIEMLKKFKRLHAAE